MIKAGMSASEIATRFQSETFEKEFRNIYKYDMVREELNKMIYELNHYNKVLENTPFRCVYGEDGSLQYYHMCQKCGNILHDPHDEMYVADHDMMCPTCNDLDIETYPFRTIKRGTMHWIHLVRSAQFNDTYNEEHPERAGYISGSAQGLAFGVTRWMAVKWWVFVRWMKIRSVASDIRHPVKYIKAIKKRNDWRKEMEVL